MIYIDNDGGKHFADCEKTKRLFEKLGYIKEIKQEIKQKTTAEIKGEKAKEEK